MRELFIVYNGRAEHEHADPSVRKTHCSFPVLHFPQKHARGILFIGEPLVNFIHTEQQNLVLSPSPPVAPLLLAICPPTVSVNTPDRCRMDVTDVELELRSKTRTPGGDPGLLEPMCTHARIQSIRRS